MNGIKCYMIFYFLFYICSYFFEYIPYFEYICDNFRLSFHNYFKYSVLNNSDKTLHKKCINIIGPHGMLMNAPISIGIFSISKKDIKNNVLLVSKILTYNPIVNIVSKCITYGNPIYPLENETIKKLLKERKYNLCLSGGGFEEMNFYNNNNHIIYTGRWKYWIKKAILNNYDINFCYCYNGNSDYDIFYEYPDKELKKRLTRNYIPFNFPVGKYLIFPKNDYTLYEFSYNLKLPNKSKITNKIINKYYKRLFENVKRLIEKYNTGRKNKFRLVEEYQ